MRVPENIRAVEALGIDWMGFIFYEKSSRFVSRVPSYLPERTKRVGVFVDAPVDYVRKVADDFGLDILQFHGVESPEYVASFADFQTIKAFCIRENADLHAVGAYEDAADYFLFDTKAKMVGGNGLKFDWTILSSYNDDTPFLLSGGIGPEDVTNLRTFSHPRLAGIDLNSRFEQAPAVKDVQLLNKFLKHYEQDR